MKKLVVLAFALVLASCNQTKIAYIDVEDLMKDYEATKVLEETLKAKQETMAKELDSLGAPFQAKVQAYYKEAQRMSASKRAQAEQALQQENQMLQAKQQEAAQILQKENQERSEEITKRVDSFVTNYAKEKGLHLVLGTSGQGTVMYGDDKLNITDEILKVLNDDFAKE
ncbi:periplasmic chaperone for outer membrane proteins Skp [Lutibacter oricola]|uniref:Periplasmic chaperone for outer membrane proteins Skp n=1 Tax=Lutibacter oricola TaxID=762486 RepID=A0A1H2QM64_9FLAO|nr:OmpH family outer membrane protein [Lutibacter oricola]SDW08010.1 periplasmic chaperone for outer membrane proteins Skp [Lutibacter oricola]